MFELFLAGSMHDCKLEKSKVKQHSKSGEELEKKKLLIRTELCSSGILKIWDFIEPF